MRFRLHHRSAAISWAFCHPGQNLPNASKMVGWLAAGLLASGTAHAVLVDRGGGLIYDSVLNITWLKGTNYAQTSGYDSDGRMSWSAANTWAANLSYYDSVRNVTYSDWRLPFVTDTGTSGCNFSFNGTDCGYNVQTVSGGTVYSEMAYMLYLKLGNKAFFNSSGVGPQAGGGRVDDPANPNDESLFIFHGGGSDTFWFGTAYAPFPAHAAWYIDSASGSQNFPRRGT
jgi:hypothetical protein